MARTHEEAVVAAVYDLAAARGWTTVREVADRTGLSDYVVRQAAGRLSAPAVGVLSLDRLRRPMRIRPGRSQVPDPRPTPGRSELTDGEAIDALIRLGYLPGWAFRRALDEALRVGFRPHEPEYHI